MSVLCLIHGFASDRRAWAQLTPQLGSPWVSLDLSGHGEGPPARANGSFEQAAKVALHALEKQVQSDQKIHLVGYSLGARISLSLLEIAPERFARATLVGVNPGLTTDLEREQRAEQDQGWQSVLRNEGVEAFERKWSALPLWRSQASLPKRVLDAQRALRCAQSPVALADALAQMSLSKMPNYWPRLGAFCAQLQDGLHLVVGAQDTKFLRIAEQMRVAAPALDLSVIEGAGHNVVLEAPEALRALLQAR